MSDTLDIMENITYDELQEGDSATYERTLTEDVLVLFAAVSGDVNPVHLDPEYAAGTEYKERIAHGMWSGSLVSAALATVMPGPGSIYREQNLTFKQAARLGDTLTVNLKVIRKARMNLVFLSCDVRNQNGEQIAIGEAKVIAPAKKLSVPKPRLPRIIIEY